MTSVLLRLGMLDAREDSTCHFPRRHRNVSNFIAFNWLARETGNHCFLWNYKSSLSIKLQIIVFYETTNHCFLWNYKSLFSIYWKRYTRLYGKPFMFWFLSIRFGPEYFLKMNISVNISDLRPCSHCYKNVILEFRPLYFAEKCPQNAGNAVSGTQNSTFSRGVYPRTPYKCVVTV